jgi:uncharacterized paraquat-inducible protein A
MRQRSAYDRDISISVLDQSPIDNLAALAYSAVAMWTVFAAVVVLTMIAAESFDPRLIWDSSVSETHS